MEIPIENEEKKNEERIIDGKYLQLFTYGILPVSIHLLEKTPPDHGSVAVNMSCQFWEIQLRGCSAIIFWVLMSTPD